MTAADALRDAVAKMVADAGSVRQHTISKVNTDGTVDLAYSLGTIESVPCSGAYPVHTVGDKVSVLRYPSGNFEVLAKSNA